MSVLSAYKLSKSFNIFPIFKDVTFQINPGEKVALVGVNGAGKSTLMRIIAGEERADSGEIVTTRGLKIAYLPQEVTFDSNRTLYAEMLSVFDDVREMQAEINSLEQQMSASHDGNFEALMERYGELTHRFELIGGYDYEIRIHQVLSGLSFERDMYDMPLNKFSGGQKTRAALARSLLAGPDLLLLDEPTNHLDLKTLEWLEDFLSGWQGAILIISHDRFFLDRVVSRVMDLSFGRIEDYPGNYSKYLTLRAERLERAVALYEAQQEQIAKTEEYIRRYRAGQRAKEARGRQKKLDRLERLDRPKEKDKLHLSLQTDLRSGRLVLATEDLKVGYHTREGIKALFKSPDLEIQRGERVAIIGPNGSGKSSFLKTIMGDITPLEGMVELGTNVRIGYYAQSHEGLNFKNTVLEEILWAQPMSEGAARNFLGRFLFSGDDVYKKVEDLSGGERSRVALAKLTLTKANLLILDEPTNHLDINAREALEEVLSEYGGTLLMVSHDRYFIDALATQVWEVGDGKITVYLGNYTDYLGWISRAKEREAEQARQNSNSNGASKPQAQVTYNGSMKAASKDERSRQRKLNQLEQTIAQKEARLTKIGEELNKAGEKQDFELLTRLSNEYQEITTEIEKLYEDWGALAG
ncbi:MAG TPA: ABC-F family ATP-binding cassette domain-containing protein [Chloroflexia bacterium]|nr:ABC-F family ATP-binding cassette domain-containing protein [Chloroflexia bacterium]